MGLRYKEFFTVPFDMTDVKQELKIPSFLSYCLGVSGRQSESIGRSDMAIFKQYQLVWIVTDYELTIQRLPRYGETIVVETEAVSYNKFFCYRKFFIYDETNELLMEILCYFVLLDFQTRKVVPVPEDLIAPYQSEKVKKMTRTPKYPELENPTIKEFQVRYFDIDMNGHVNNSKYLEWMYEALEYPFLRTHFPKKIHLKYVKEVAPEGQIASCTTLTEKISQHAIFSEGTLHAQAIMEWQELIEKEKE